MSIVDVLYYWVWVCFFISEFLYFLSFSQFPAIAPALKYSKVVIIHVKLTVPSADECCPVGQVAAAAASASAASARPDIASVAQAVSMQINYVTDSVIIISLVQANLLTSLTSCCCFNYCCCCCVTDKEGDAVNNKWSRFELISLASRLHWCKYVPSRHV